MKIYTRTGDSGKTQLFGGLRVQKDNLIIEACGTLDELNSVLGLVYSGLKDNEKKGKIQRIQKNIFTLGVELNGAQGYRKIGQEEINKLEEWIDEIEITIPKLTHFILPSGDKNASLVHVARAICRRSERRVVKLSESETLRDEVVAYLNRLSDYLFMLAREINHNKKIQEVEWKGKKLL